MADLIQIKAGNNVGKSLADREIAYSRNEEALYIGDNGKNVKLTRKADAVVQLAEDADLPAVISAYNSLVSALKASGLMKEG